MTTELTVQSRILPSSANANGRQRTEEQFHSRALKLPSETIGKSPIETEIAEDKLLYTESGNLQNSQTKERPNETESENSSDLSDEQMEFSFEGEEVEQKASEDTELSMLGLMIKGVYASSNSMDQGQTLAYA